MIERAATWGQKADRRSRMTLMLFLLMFLTVTYNVKARQQQAGGSPGIATQSRTFRAPTDDEVTYYDSCFYPYSAVVSGNTNFFIILFISSYSLSSGG